MRNPPHLHDPVGTSHLHDPVGTSGAQLHPRSSRRQHRSSSTLGRFQTIGRCEEVAPLEVGPVGRGEVGPFRHGEVRPVGRGNRCGFLKVGPIGIVDGLGVLLRCHEFAFADSSRIGIEVHAAYRDASAEARHFHARALKAGERVRGELARHVTGGQRRREDGRGENSHNGLHPRQLPILWVIRLEGGIREALFRRDVDRVVELVAQSIHRVTARFEGPFIDQHFGQ
mmetsp:Transcript_28200/g.63838  ORF Transcript_28200/g.63838 Transcript_28200/m.63838 type:complete len:227 (-) Transcript_28200:821-1501(-)